MKKYLLLLLALSATQAHTQERSIATLTVADFQEMYESDKERTQQAIQTYFNGYEVGFYDGVMSALVAARVITDRPVIDFTDCMPDTRKLVYEMMSVTDARADLTVPSFVMNAVLDRCSPQIAGLASPPPKR